MKKSFQFLWTTSLQKSVKEEPAELLLQVRHPWEKIFDVSDLRAGLKNADTRWRTLNLIEKLRVVSVHPEVREAFQKVPDHASISVLAEIGTAEGLQLLFASIPRVVNLKDRANRQIRPINIPVIEGKGAFEYSRIVEALARLATPDAIAHLKLASRDYDPTVRKSACEVLGGSPLDKVDAEIAGLIHERMKDPMAYVREAAKEASIKLVL
jgi:hypothetical protein